VNAPLPDYYSRINHDLLRRIPVDARGVLEIGCGAGALGAAYKRINPDCFYAGVELMAEPARYDTSRLDHVQVLNVDEQPLTLPGNQPLDCLIYGDVLEHLREPWTVLKKHLEHLSDDGMLLACIPNVQHWSVFANLLQGHWPLADEGIFDRTHLRWFTRQSVVDLVQSAGLHLVDITPRIFGREKAEAFFEKMKPALEAMGINPLQFAQGAAPLQYIVRASRKPIKPLSIDALMLRPVGGVNDVRITMPLAAMATHSGVSVRAQVKQLSLQNLHPDTPRVILWQRPILTYKGELATMRNLIQKGYLLVVEFDDHPMRWPAIEENKYLNYTGVHAVQTSTQPLAQLFRQFNPEVEIFSNTVSELPETRNFVNKDRLNLFFGALNREEDWGPLMPSLNQFLAQYADKLNFEIVHDRAFFDALETPNKRFTETCEYPAFRQLMGGCDIAFLPLADNLFNQMKSDLKFVEAGAHGLAALASPTVYAQSIQDNKTGRLFSNADEMIAILTEWVQSPDKAQKIGENAHAWVRQNRLIKHQVARREAWLRDLWQRREELTAKLYERVPEMRP